MRQLKRLCISLFALSIIGTVSVATNAPVSAKASNLLLGGNVAWDDERPASSLDIRAVLRIPADARADAPAEVNLPLAASAKTSKSGAFSLALNPATVPAPYVDQDGAVALTVMLFQGDEMLGVHNVDVYQPTTKNGSWTPERVPEAKTDDLFQPLARTPEALSLSMTLSSGGSDGAASLDAQSTSGMALTSVSEGLADADVLGENLEPASERTSARVTDGLTPVKNAPWGCADSDQGSVGNQDTILQTTGSNSSYVEYDYEFNQNSSETDSISLGIGYSNDGRSGSFTTGGKTKVSSSVKIDYRASRETGRFHYYTKTRYHKFLVSCTWGGSIPHLYYEVRPMWVTGDQWRAKFSTRGYHLCTRIEPGGSIERSSGSTIHYTNGVKLGALGSNLEVKNDLERGDSHRVRFTNKAHSTRKYVCGQHATIGSRNRTGILVGDWQDR